MCPTASRTHNNMALLSLLRVLQTFFCRGPRSLQTSCVVAHWMWGGMPPQLHGLNWMLSKWLNAKSCILADEMGLGKTIQTASLLATGAALGIAPAPFLVVVPLSTLSGACSSILSQSASHFRHPRHSFSGGREHGDCG